MILIEIIYKTIFNHFVKKEGFNSTTYALAGAATFLCAFLFLVNCFFIFNILSGNAIPFSFSKGMGMLLAALLLTLNHLLLFNILKFSKKGDLANNLFNISKETTKLGWWVFGLVVFLGVAVPIIYSYYKEH